QLLLDLAAYPIQHEAVFQVPVTVITKADPPQPLHPSVPFTATALLADKDFRRTDGKIVNLLCVMPAYRAEAALALQFIPDFLNALDRSGVSRIFAPNRPSLVT
ncbi:MAG TPA: hypothetical protein DCF63_08490, partial [Planctomycetaceae bacterium]|nr:hypothetical protein [Planctomycetaceae bacterium]